MARPASLPPSRLDELPPELVEEAARNLSNASLLALGATSRTLRRKSYYVYGERFFHTLKFCLHPFSLQALTDIANHPLLAKHVQHVAFGMEDFGLLDPIHDEEAKRITSSNVHSQLVASPLPVDALINTRARVDALTILQALTKFTKLKLVMVGAHLELQGQPVRSSWGARRIKTFECPSKHCQPSKMHHWIRTVFGTVAMSLEQLQTLEVRICISIEQEDQDTINLLPLGQSVWYPSPRVLQRINHLILNVRLEDQFFLSQYLKPLVDGGQIEILDVKYLPVLNGFVQLPYSSSTGLDLLSLQHLKQVTFERLYCKASVLVNFFRHYANQLTYISLKECSVSSGLGPLTHGNDSSESTWLNVILQLQSLPSLSILKLERLESDASVFSRYFTSSSWDPEGSTRNLCFDRDLTLRAIWEDKEVANGLAYLKLTHSTIEISDIYMPYEAGIDSQSFHRTHFLNLRFANFKAGARYAWTKEELERLRPHRRQCYRKIRAGKQVSMLDDDTIFPVPGTFPGGNRWPLPLGSVVLPNLFLNGNKNWKTVWINARL